MSDFDESLYHVGSVSRGESKKEEEEAKKEEEPNDDKYLIATSEQPLCCLHMEEVLNVRKKDNNMHELISALFLGKATPHPLRWLFHVLPKRSWKVWG